MNTLESPPAPIQGEWDNERKRLIERIDYLQNRQAQMDNDWVIMCERLLDEANERDWCDEYDDIVDGINKKLSVFKIPTRKSPQECVLRLTIAGTAMSSFDDDVHSQLSEICDMVEDHLRYTLNDTDDITVSY